MSGTPLARPLPFLACAFAAGIATADAVGRPAQLALLCLLAAPGLLAAGAALAVARSPAARARDRSRWTLVLLAAAFVALGAGAHADRLARAERGAPGPRGCDATVDARVAEVVRVGGRIGERESGGPASGSWLVSLVGARAASREAAGCVPARIELWAWDGDPEARAVGGLHEGERIRARLHLERPRGRANPGSPDTARAARRRGVGARARLVAPGLLHRERNGNADAARGSAPGRLRERVARRLQDAGRGGALLAALALGEGRGVDRVDREAAARLGIAHLLAVSGLHVAMVLAGGFAVARRGLLHLRDLAHRRDVRPLAWAAALALAAGYAWLAGGRPPVVRAWLLALFAVGGLWIGRRRAGAEAVAAAALCVMAWEPATLFELGPQLSFAACAALLAARPPAGAPGGAWGFARTSLAASSAAVAATAPVLAAHGLSASPWALLANLVAVPWCAAIGLPLALVASLAALPGLAGGLPGCASDAVVSGCARLALLHLDGLVGLASLLPAASPLPAPPVPIWSLGLAAGIAWAGLSTGSLAVRCAACGAVLGLLRVVPPPAIDPPPPRVVALDVGQGDAVLVQGSRGTMLVDAGGAVPGRWDAGRAVVVPALRALGVERLDALVVTHADLDHRGGAAAVLDALPVGELWVPHGFDPDLGSALARRARAHGARLCMRGADTPPQRLGDLEIEVLWPPPEVAGPRNERSLVLRVAVAGRSLLLTGDAGRATEAALLARGARIRSDVLKVGHHGSDGGSDPAFLAAVRAALALVPAPFPGRRGLPAAPALARLEAAGARVTWTGRDGAVLVGLGSPLVLRTWRGSRRGSGPGAAGAGATCAGRCRSRPPHRRGPRRRRGRAAPPE